MSPKPPKLAEPGTSPRFPENFGAVKRQKPIWTREQFGPWRCDVAVTPITGIRRGYALFEVRCAWEAGPPLIGRDTTQRGVYFMAADQYVVDREAPDMQLTAQEAQELAVELAKRAADLLAEAVKPDLALLARAIRQRAK